MSISPPPVRDKLIISKDNGGNVTVEMSRAWIKWFTDIKNFISPMGDGTSSGGGISWDSISKVGSNLTDIITRRHQDLTDLNSSQYTHLTAIEAEELTHGSSTILHKHDHNLQANLQGGTTDEYFHVTETQHTNLTDGGDTTLHYHLADRIHARNSALHRV